MLTYRLTFEGDKGSVYSYIDRYDSLEVGEWGIPFPNEEGNSTAFGLCENLMQSDGCPSCFYSYENIIRVKVEEVNESVKKG